MAVVAGWCWQCLCVHRCAPAARGGFLPGTINENHIFSCLRSARSVSVSCRSPPLFTLPFSERAVPLAVGEAFVRSLFLNWLLDTCDRSPAAAAPLHRRQPPCWRRRYGEEAAAHPQGAPRARECQPGQFQLRQGSGKL